MTYDCTDDIMKHILLVKKLIYNICLILKDRTTYHDISKLKEPEKSVFDEYTPKLKDMEFGSTEYNECLNKMYPALNHHYSYNPHHPQYHSNGIKDMNLVDIIEMLCDWMASAKRNKNGDIKASIEYNQKRFGYSEELKQILYNTVKVFDSK